MLREIALEQKVSVILIVALSLAIYMVQCESEEEPRVTEARLSSEVSLEELAGFEHTQVQHWIKRLEVIKHLRGNSLACPFTKSRCFQPQYEEAVFEISLILRRTNQLDKLEGLL